ncbi:hypothetical protein [Paenibacillus sp. FSL R7-0273]|uniref:hypothetical protein n=1 Tax=Paenibacillus sp. FSL R7-0273 TaxID=1536772 RepID=UPI00063F81B8|nr:hypothetical protein [Paenibacillus sp. FSL R7-0273]OMF88049.1 hypothetical protein BK144_22885 [Paenibacillus sp. FSL R7-0273]
MGKSSFISGLGLIMLSSILFTAERFIAVYKWIGETTPVKINGSGSYPAEPAMPGVFDNVFVGIFLILGLALLIIGLSRGIKKSS